jgi:hypothetical protein
MLKPRRPLLQQAGAGRPLHLFLVFLSVVAVLAGIEFYALYQHKRAISQPAAAVAAAAPAAIGATPVGDIDAPSADAVFGPRVTISGWAIGGNSERGPTALRGVEIRLDGRTFAARTGIARPDVAAAKPEYAAYPSSGFEFTGDFTPFPASVGVDSRTLTVVAIGSDGRETVLGRRRLIEPAARERWAAFASKTGTPFYLLPALSGIDLGGASELDTVYRPYISPTLRAGFRVPILYLRMTKGEAADYAFDPDWDPKRKCGQRRIGDDSLNAVLAHAKAHDLPVLLTLNGGIWADAYCDVPEWDINDKLEKDPQNCQWNEKNEVMPDGFLKDLPGSQEAPELARSLTFNVHATQVRHYKKRNLQQAAVSLVAFARENPALFVGVNLDPDVYLNPFFAEKQWYDYNPGTLRQFREWLAGTGPYAGRAPPGVPDLRAYRRLQPLSLADVNRLAQRKWRTWNEVDPPRVFARTVKDGAKPFWQDPWVREWEIFRRHLVHLHYDELAQWLVEAGIARDRIWSSQGLMPPHGDSMSFAIDLDSSPRNYDSGGMSIAGSKPALGHLGVILYGEAAVNDVRMDNDKSLFATLAAVDPQWAVVEYNTADLRNPQALPTYAAAYRGLRDLWNFGARYVSPMAWNGSNGMFAGQPGYSTFTAWRNTPLEDAARDFMLARAGLPVGSLLWTFGTPAHADDDGWTAELGGLGSRPGYLSLEPDASGRMAIVSPKGLPAGAQDAAGFVIGLDSHAGLRRVRVQMRRSADSGWETLADATSTQWREEAAGIVVPRSAGTQGPIEQLRMEMTFSANTARQLARVALIMR